MKAVAAFLFFIVFMLVSCSDTGTDGKLEYPDSTPTETKESRIDTLRGTLLDGSLFEEGVKRNFTKFSPKVELVELDEGLAQSGRIADGSIDIGGNYLVSTDGFKNRYAELSIYGSAHPQCSTDPVNFKYSVLVDLESDSVVNLNYFAHLASARAKWLIKKEDMNFDAAWKKAERETHELFALSDDFSPIRSSDLNGTKFEIEDLSLTMLAEVVATRLSRDVLDMQGRIADEFARYGTRAARDTSGDVLILAFTAFMKLHRMDEFYDCELYRLRIGFQEKSDNEQRRDAYSHIDTLWRSLMQEKICDASLEGTVHAIADSAGLVAAMRDFPIARGEEYYVCSEGFWRYLKDLEYVQHVYTDSKDADMITFRTERFVYEDETGWRRADSVEYKLRSSCTKATEGKEFDYSYICHDGRWQPMNYDSVYAVTCNDKGEPVQKGKKIEGYICDSGKAFRITSMDVLLDKYCTDFNAGEVINVGYSRAVCDDDWKWMNTPIDTLTDSRDGTKYPVIGVGNQRWLGTNLKYIDTTGNENLRGNAWCNYSCGTMGAFYTWSAAMNIPDTTTYDSLKFKLPYQGICPEGWHMPSAAEWDTLQAFAKKYDLLADSPMESLTGRLWTIFIDPKNTFGLDILAAGYRTNGGAFKKEDSYAYYWYAVETPEKFPFYYIWDTKPEFQHGVFGDPKYALTVRCVANEEE